MNNIQKGGIIKWLMIVIALVALASFYFDFSVQEVVEDEQTQSNISYVSTHVSDFYKTYLSEKVNYLWNDVFLDFIWTNFKGNMETLKEGDSTRLNMLNTTLDEISK